MNDFIFSFNIIMPIFVLILLGYFLKRIGIFHDEFLKVANSFTFKVLLPILLFCNVFSTNIVEAFNLKVILYAGLGVIAICTTLMLIIPLFVKDRKRISVIIQGIFRTNFILFGIPLSESMFGVQGSLMASVVAAIYVPIINILATVVLFIYSDNENKSIKNVFKEVMLNPLVIGGILGLILSYARARIGFDLPYFINKSLVDIKAIASPFAFIILGADLKFKSILGNMKFVLIGTIGKLVVIPGVFLTLAYLLGFSGVDFAILLAVFATPNAVSSYPMAIQYNADSKLAGELVISSTIFSMFTLFVFIYISRLIGVL